MSGDTQSLAAQAQAAEIARIKAEKPASFTVGAHWNGRRVDGGVSYDRKWSNGWGVTAYARAWWEDAAVLPRDRRGAVVGAEVVKRS